MNGMMTLDAPPLAAEPLSPGLDAVSVLPVGSLAEFIRASRHARYPIVWNMSLQPEDLEKLVFLMGSGIQRTRAFGEIRAIRHDPANRHSIAESCAAHPFHTDGTFMESPPRQFCLYFQHTDQAGGGTSTFVNIANLLAAMPARYVKALALARVRFRREGDQCSCDEWTGPMLSHSTDGELVFRWRHDSHVQPEIVDTAGQPIAEAITLVRDMLLSAEAVTYHAKPKDLLLVPNRGVLHGRTELSADTQRLVYRMWIH